MRVHGIPILNKTIVLVLNRNWQAISIRTPADAFCQMATNVATALAIEGENYPSSVALPMGLDIGSAAGQVPEETIGECGLRRVDIRPVTWDDWITLPIRDADNAVLTVRGRIRVPTGIVSVNFAKCQRSARSSAPRAFVRGTTIGANTPESCSNQTRAA
jgi:hypothetical protein